MRVSIKPTTGSRVNRSKFKASGKPPIIPDASIRKAQTMMSTCNMLEFGNTENSTNSMIWENRQLDTNELVEFEK